MASRTFIGRTTNTSQLGSYTYTNHAIGTAAADRKVVVVVIATQIGTASFTPSITIGGSAATIDKSQLGGTDPVGGDRMVCFIASRDVASGTTATIVFNGNGPSFFDCTVFVYALYGVNGVTGTGGASATGPQSTALAANTNVANGDIVIGGEADYWHTTTPSTTWSGLTKDANHSVYGGDYLSSASHVATANETPRSISCSFTQNWSGGSIVIAVVAYAPANEIEITADFTEPNESLSATATNLVSGSAAFTEPGETLSATASHPVIGAADFTEPDETLSAAVAGATQANAAFTEPNETVAAETSHPVLAVGLQTAEPNETLSAAAGALAAATAAFTEPEESVSAAAGVTVTAALDQTEADETLGSLVDTGVGFVRRVGGRMISMGIRIGI